MTQPPELQETIAALVTRLQTAWNEGDSEGFAAEFTDDADFVNVRGDYASGRKSIAEGHAHIFSTIYSGSAIRYSLSHLRSLTPMVCIAHLDAQLEIPTGPMAGTIKALPSLVLVLNDGTWQIAAFQNTPRMSG